MRAIGVSPHQYIRVARFQEAVRLMKTTRFSNLADLAHHLSYADQSHFIKDVNEFSGYTPARLAEIVRTCVDFPCGVIPARALSDAERTYDIFAAYWPFAEGGSYDDIATAIQPRQKIRGDAQRRRPHPGRARSNCATAPRTLRN